MSQIYASLPPLLGFAAWSGTGKTTLLEAMLPKLVERGIRVAVIKHAHHNFDIDQEGKDSYRLRKAGAGQMLISSRYRRALVTETPEEEATLPQLIAPARSNPNSISFWSKALRNSIFLKLSFIARKSANPGCTQTTAISLPSLLTSMPPNTNVSNTNASTELPQLDINDLEQLTDFVVGFATQDSNESFSCNDINPTDMMSVDEGRALILEQIVPPESQTKVPLKQALGTNCLKRYPIASQCSSAYQFGNGRLCDPRR